LYIRGQDSSAILSATSSRPPGGGIFRLHSSNRHFGHYLTAGVPGRHDLDEEPEAYYLTIMRAILNLY